jgi:hypothetical protein
MKYKLTLVLAILFLFGLIVSCSAPMNIPQETLYHAQREGAPIYIRAGLGPIPNTAGGRQVGFTVQNIGIEPIKYLTIQTKIINAVGDSISCRIGYSNAIRVTGPIKVNQTMRFSSRALCYDVPPSTLIVDSVEVIFMDERRMNIDREKLLYMKAIEK